MQDVGELIDRAKNGDDMALASLFHGHRRMLEQFAGQHWNMGNDAEDATQMVFVRLRESLNYYEHRSDSEFRSFLIELTEQECRKLKRTWKRRVKPISHSLDDEEAVAITSRASSGSEDEMLVRVCISETLSKLSPLQQETIARIAESGEVKTGSIKSGAAYARSMAARKQFLNVWDSAP